MPTPESIHAILVELDSHVLEDIEDASFNMPSDRGAYRLAEEAGQILTDRAIAIHTEHAPSLANGNN